VKRAMAVVLLAVLTGVVSGIDAASSAPQVTDPRKEQVRRQEVAARLNDLAAGSIVRIERTDGETLRAVLVTATSNVIMVVPLGGASVRSQTIPLGEIKEVEAGDRRVVRIERIDGRTFNALLESATPDAIIVTLLQEKNRPQETIPLGKIKQIEEVRGHALRNILIGIGIGVGVCTGIVLIQVANI
jgi:hypothetical protein